LTIEGRPGCYWRKEEEDKKGGKRNTKIEKVPRHSQKVEKEVISNFLNGY
jgi:hypothetical protein